MPLYGGEWRSLGTLRRRDRPSTSERRILVEEIELAIIFGGRNGLMVSPDLSEVVRIQIPRQGPLGPRQCKPQLRHKRHILVIFDGVSSLLAPTYCSLLSFIRKLLPSMMTVSAWCRTRSRIAEVSVLSLLKICAQCL